MDRRAEDRDEFFFCVFQSNVAEKINIQTNNFIAII